MAVTQHDLELLESYLDDALDMSEVEALQTRLARETELASAMTDIRAQRALRKSIFTSFEPSEGTANAVVSNVLTATIARKPSPARRRNPAWYYATAAACLAIGFLGRGVYDQSQTGSSNLARHDPGVELQKVASYQVTLRDDAGDVVAVQRFDSMEKANEFAADLTRWQSRSERLASGRFVLSADRF